MDHLLLGIADLDRGIARTKEGVLLCGRCLRRSGRFRAGTVVLIPLSLLSAAAQTHIQAAAADASIGVAHRGGRP